MSVGGDIVCGQLISLARPGKLFLIDFYLLHKMSVAKDKNLNVQEIEQLISMDKYIQLPVTPTELNIEETL